MAKQHTFKDIQAGDTVHYQGYNGMGLNGPEYTPRRGRAVMKGPAGWVLNAGGRYGRPAICDESNFIKVTKGKRN